MSTELDVFEILMLAALAAFLGLRLWSVLGRRTGHERPRPDTYSAPERTAARERHGADEPVVVMPGRQSDPVASGTASDVTLGDTTITDVFRRISQADRSFDSGSFLSGAKTAYEMIITAFARGDKRTLKPLLSDEVYETFNTAITERERRGESRELTLVGINRAEVTDATFDGAEAEITVTFASEQIAFTKNVAGAVIQGDPTTIRQVTDVWTFARNTQSSDPNWLLVGTAAG